MMATVTTKDGVEIFYKDWGRGQPIVFSHGWPLSSDDWDAQMLFFLGRGYRVVAHDRRGHGRSAQVGEGHDMDHYADDLAAVTAHLDLGDTIHVGHSTGGGEVVRYLARHGGSRVAKAAIISTVPPLMVKTAANPGGQPKEVFDGFQAQLAANRSAFYRAVAAGPFYNYDRPGAQPSEAIIQNWWRQGMMGGAKAHYDGIVAFSQTDFTADLQEIGVPVLVMHSEDDQIVPYAAAGPLSARLLRHGTLKTYKGFPHGMPTTQAETINADLLAFIERWNGRTMRDGSDGRRRGHGSVAHAPPGVRGRAQCFSAIKQGGCPMSSADHYDVLVVGSGEGGKYLAWHMARAGHRTAVVERRLIGGSCPNTNCLPSKNEIWSAKVAELVRHADRFGSVTGSAAVDVGQVLGRKRAMVDGFVATRVLTAGRLVLNLGTHATMPEIPGLAEAAPLSNVEILELDTLPDHLVVLGGGYVGLEFAQCFRRFGSAVKVIEPGPRLAAREDPEVGDALRDLMADEGVSVALGATVARVAGRSGDAVTAHLSAPCGSRAITGSHILRAAGRTPNTAGIGLEHAGVTLDGRGYVTVNDRLETSAAETWALGECAGSPQFTHAAFDDFRVVRDTWAGGTRSTRGRLMPYCMYTDPPLARVGLSAGEAARLGKAVRVATLPIANVLRARTISETRGFMQAVVDAGSDRILGFTMIGPDAGKVLATVQTAMLAAMPYTGLRDAILTHPTMAEGLNALFARVPAR